MSGSELTAVLAYAKSIDKVMYLGGAVSISVWTWKDIRKVKELQVITDKSPDSGDRESAVVGEK
ncbi:uncharacterized protein N7500_004528 [Penicillium coprophilum]|uniref:uncharacterized protein n=1 Tax=Penicillium coprophilum TaxID=36646 RepID=UPI00239ABED9|nr:uncharacterized protein N7500_004528 [Penicillium coprophilum]KAJ5162698.1 hypothetical protein N7500_004528 [Penicillium coprophilum]